MAWIVIALPAALFALYVRQLSTREWRDSAIRALVMFGLLVAMFTEILGAVGELRQVPLFLSWCAVFVAAVFPLFGQRELQFFRLPAFSPLNTLAVSGIVAIIGIIGFVALLSPPNSTDAMAYHMPRVIYWAQQASVSFFPTPYYNQIMLQPLAEYFMLHTFVLSGGDHFVNLVQWLGMAGTTICVSLIAQLLGAQARGQVIAALFAVTLPNGILQASGAKNDYLLALWLASIAYFGLRYVQQSERADLVYCGCSLGLALLTKGTAYLYVPGILLAVILPTFRKLGTRSTLQIGGVLGGCALLINAPQYARNSDLSGSPLGFDSAHGDGFFRWRNERFGWKQTVSNLLRNAGDQFAGRSPVWNQGVYDTVAKLHQWMHADLNDPDTTWRWTKYEPPRNTNHETNAGNRWHLLLLLGVATVICFSSTKARRLKMVYLFGVVLGFVLFCFYLKWQLFLARMFLPLFVLAAPLAGTELERLRPVAIQCLLCLFLLNNSRPYLFENWVRPLKGPNSILHTSRDENYFSDMSAWHNRSSYFDAVKLTTGSGCSVVGIDIHEFPLEYPFQALMRERNPRVRFLHTGVSNASAKYAFRQPEQPCVVLCMDCAGKTERLNLYRDFSKASQAGNFVVFLR